MERGSDKVSPRVDDELKAEMQALLQSGTHESHTEEWKLQEPSGEDQPEVGEFGPDESSANTHEVGDDTVALRSQLSIYLTRSAFPMVRAMVIEEAEGKNAPDSVIETLHRLPAGVEFTGVVDLADRLSQA